MRITFFLFFLFSSSTFFGQKGFGLKFEDLMGAEVSRISKNTFDIADFDGDGDLEYVAVFNVDEEPHFGIIWNSNNNFFQEETIEELSNAEDIQAHDFNNDGLPDIIIDGSKFWKNLGNRQFEQVEIETSFNFAPGYFVTDYDEDGLLDIMIGTPYVDGGVYLLMNNGNFEFSETHLIVSSQLDEPVFYEDMDLDGQRDIIIGNNGDIKIFFNDNGVFNRDTVIAESVGAPAVVHDLTNDGYPDIVSLGYNNSKFFLNDECKDFPSETLSGNKPTSVGILDLDLDGLLDIVVARDDYKKVAWFSNNGDSTFSSSNYFNGVADGHVVKVNDFNGDGKMDLFAFLGGNNDLIGVYVNESDSTGTNGEGIPNSSLEISRLCHFGRTWQTTAFDVLDVDGDRDVDVAATNSYFEELVWWENQNDSMIRRVIFQESIHSDYLAAGDFDNNGTIDFIVHDEIHSEYDEHIIGFFQNDQGKFISDTVMTIPNNQGVSDIFSGDFTNDGKDEVILRRSKNGKLYTELYVLGEENELILTWSKLVNLRNFKPEILDLDKDGNLDIVWPGDDGVAFIWLRGDGTGAFNDSIVTSDEGFIEILHATDYNQDGNMDFISDEIYSDYVLFWENQGDNTFSLDTLYKIPDNSYYYELETGDADGDGDVDIFISMDYYTGPCILENRVDTIIPHFPQRKIGYYEEIISLSQDESSLAFMAKNDQYIQKFSTCTFSNLDLSKADSTFCKGDTLKFDYWLQNTSSNSSYNLYNEDGILVNSFAGSDDSTLIKISQFTPLGTGFLPNHYFLKGNENGCIFSYTDTISIQALNTPQINPFNDEKICEEEEVFVRTSNYGVTRDIISWYENGEEGYNTVNSDTTFIFHSMDTITGCSNSDTMFVFVQEPIDTVVYDTICANQTYEFGGNTISQSGTYEYAYHSSFGCDSVVTLHLENVDVEAPTITLSGTDSLITQEGYEEYTWIICPDEEEVPDNSGTNIYEPNTTGNYAVRIKKDGCTMFSNCFFFEYIGINELENINHLISYIDGNGMLHIQLKSEAPSGKIHLLDANGRILQTANIQNLKEFNMDMKGYSTGIYFVFVEGFAPVKLMRTGL